MTAQKSFASEKRSTRTKELPNAHSSALAFAVARRQKLRKKINLKAASP